MIKRGDFSDSTNDAMIARLEKALAKYHPDRKRISAKMLMEALNEVSMTVCSEMFLDYSILGGMPAVIREYILKGTFEGSLETQRQLLADYKEDIRKYAGGMDRTIK